MVRPRRRLAAEAVVAAAAAAAAVDSAELPRLLPPPASIPSISDTQSIAMTSSVDFVASYPILRGGRAFCSMAITSNSTCVRFLAIEFLNPSLPGTEYLFVTSLGWCPHDVSAPWYTHRNLGPLASSSFTSIKAFTGL